MKKNSILWILSVLLVCAVAWMATKTVHKIHGQNELKEKNSMLRELPLFSMDSLKYDLLNKTEPVVLILFNTGCEHCQYEASQIKKSITSFSQASILMVSSEPLATIKEFSVKYGLNDQPNVSFFKINAEDVFETFGSGSIPRIFIYGKDRMLIKEFKGEVKIEAILKYLP